MLVREARRASRDWLVKASFRPARVAQFRPALTFLVAGPINERAAPARESNSGTRR
jgi:hypothetical protein